MVFERSSTRGTACRHCGAVMSVGSTLCPRCGRFQLAVLGDLAYWRREHLTVLERRERDGASHVRWEALDDGRLCERCERRRGRRYTLVAARAELEGRFCEADPYRTRCRCTWVADEAAVVEATPEAEAPTSV